MVKAEQIYEEEFKAGALLKLQPSMDWHNAYVLNEHGRLGEEIRIERDDVVMYMETQINRFQPDVKRYKCLFGDRFILMLGASLRAV
jgi:streptogramin lyase